MSTQHWKYNAFWKLVLCHGHCRHVCRGRHHTTAVQPNAFQTCSWHPLTRVSSSQEHSSRAARYILTDVCSKHRPIAFGRQNTAAVQPDASAQWRFTSERTKMNTFVIETQQACSQMHFNTIAADIVARELVPRTQQPCSQIFQQACMLEVRVGKLALFVGTRQRCSQICFDRCLRPTTSRLCWS